MNDFIRFRQPGHASAPLRGKPPHIIARKKARTKLYAMLYGPCASGVPHENQPWHDKNRLGSNLPAKAEFDALSKAACFNPAQTARVNAHFVHLGGKL
jgi:hypothetical protein